jgi:electron transfer flavoprotein beta subunit
MFKSVACYKWVADEADIKIKSDLTVDVTKAKGKISDYDKNAIEAAVQSAKQLEGRSFGLTFGTSKAKESLKDALSRGLEEAYWINAQEADTADGNVTAKALSAALTKIGDVSLVICAEGASDTYARQTAPRIGAILDWPVITSVTELKIEGNTITAVRRLEKCSETVKTEMPAVVAVLPEANTPTVPGLKAVMAAGKKPVTELKSTDIGIDLTPKCKESSIKGYVTDRKNIIFSDGDAAQQAKELALALRKEGIL